MVDAMVSIGKEHSMPSQTITYHNDGTQTWPGEIIDGVLIVHAAHRDGRPRDWYVLPEKSVMIVGGPWYEEVPPHFAYLVHIIDVEQIAADTWEVFDREADIVVEPDCRTYRVIDMDDLAHALECGSMTREQVCRALRTLQVFVDEYLHGGGKFPPRGVPAMVEK